MSRMLFAGLIMLAAINAHATYLDPMPIEALHARADLIATGNITHVHAQWEDGRIYSYAHFATAETLVGTSPTEDIAIRIPGGEVDGLGMLAFGAPDLRGGDHVLLFLRRDPYARSWHIVGFNQGALSLRLTEDGALLEPSSTTEGSVPTTHSWPVTLRDYRAVLTQLDGVSP